MEATEYLKLYSLWTVSEKNIFSRVKLYLRNAEGIQNHSSNKHSCNQPCHSKTSICFLLTQVLPEKFALPVPGIKPEYMPLMVSGLTAAISLDKVQLFHRNKKLDFFHFIEVIQDIDFVYFRLEK